MRQFMNRGRAAVGPLCPLIFLKGTLTVIALEARTIAGQGGRATPTSMFDRHLPREHVRPHP